MKTKAEGITMLKILCLEDSPQDVEIMRELLTDAGFDLSIDIAAIEKDYASFLRGNAYDIILSDFKLPGFDGFTALRLAREICPKVPFICVSGTIGEENAVEILKRGAVDYVIKDRLARLPAAIKRALDEAKEKETREQAEETLRESETRYRSVLQSATDAIVTVDSGGIIIGWNNAAERIFGYRYTEAVGQSLTSIVSLHHHAGYPDGMNGLQFEGGQNIIGKTVEFKGLRKDKSVFPIELSLSTWETKSGQFFTGIIREITERKQAEEELKKSESKFRTIFDNASDGMFLVDLDARKFFICNAMCVKMLGYTLEEFLALNIDDIHPAEDIPFIDEQIGKFSKGEEGIRSNIRFKRKDGSIFATDLRPALLTIAEKKYLLINFNDITERMKAEEALRESELKFRNLFENSLMGISTATPEGRLLQANMAYARMYGYDNPNEMITKLANVGQLYANPEDRKEVLRILAEQGFMDPREIEVIRRDGTRFFVLVSAREFRDASGKLLYSHANHIDVTERKRTENELQESLSLLQATLESTTDGILVVNNGRKITGYNHRFAELWRLPLEVFVTKDADKALNFVLDQLKYPEMFLAQVHQLDLKPEAESSNLIEFTDGRIYEWYSCPQLIEGRGVGRVWSFCDITERKRVEESLRESKVLIDAVVENVPHMIFLKEAKDLRFIVFNRAGEELLGYDRKALLGKNNLDLFPPEQAAHFMTKDREVLDGESGMLDIPEEPIQTAKKGQRLLHTRKVCIRGANGITKYLLGISEDITDRKQAEKALQESELRFRSLYENTTVGLYRTTPDGNILLANPALVKLLGYTSFEKLAERNLEKDGFEPTYERKEFLEKIERDGEIKGHESKWMRQDGTTIFALESARAIRDAQGKILYYDGTVEDITERKQMEEGLRQMQKLEGLGTLAGGIAHDFNNILGIILAYITSTKRFKDDAKKLDLAIDTIVRAVERGKTLVQQILTFARKTETEFGAVNVNDVVMEIMTMIFETFPKILTYTQNFDKSITFINADRSQLHQVLLNLCVNARDAMPKGGVLTINTRMVSNVRLRAQHPDAAASSYVCIEVIDTGEGMTPEIQKRIFEPFFTTKEIGKGTGLGLAVVFGVVQSHHGFIDVESELGKGTTFRLYLPASQMTAPIVEKDEETLEKMPGGTETLLVVEDEEMLMMSLQMVLVDKGYKVISAGDGLSAVNIYKEQKKEIALVLTDLGLPKMSGMEVCVQIKKLNPHARMIVATGYLDPEMKSEFLKAGIQHFLFKPYELKKVLKVIREALDEKRV